MDPSVFSPPKSFQSKEGTNNNMQVFPWWLKRERFHQQCRRPRFNPRVGKILWRRERLSTPVFLPGGSPQTEEPGGLQSMGSQRVGYARATNIFTFTSWSVRGEQAHMPGWPQVLCTEKGSCLGDNREKLLPFIHSY